MSKILEILLKYTSGEYTLEEANEKMNEVLMEEGFGIFLTEEDHTFTEEERAATKVSDDPNEVNGYGILDVGDNFLRKVQVTDGKIEYKVNSLNEDGTTDKYALIIIGGRYYEIKEDKLEIL